MNKLKITPSQWIEVVKLIATFLIGIITVLAVESCSATYSIFWKNQNSKQDAKQSTTTQVDSLNVNLKK